MLTSAAIITLVYIPVFFTIRGNLLITPSQSDWYGYRLTFRSAPSPLLTGSTLSGGSSHSTHLRGVARKVLWYPIAYMAVLLPTVVCRFKAIHGTPVSLPVLLACVSLLSSMGLSNACIYVFTRNLGGEPWFARSLLTRKTDMEVFVERSTMNEMGPVSPSHNGRMRDKASQIIDAMRIPPHHPDFRFGGDLYPEIESKANEVEVDEAPLTIPKVCPFSHVKISEI